MSDGAIGSTVPAFGAVTSSGGDFVGPPGAVAGNLLEFGDGTGLLGADSGLSTAAVAAGIAAASPLLEWNGVDLTQFVDATDLSVGVSIADPTRNAIQWAPPINVTDARFFDLELPSRFRIVAEVARPTSGALPQGAGFGVDADNFMGDGIYTTGSSQHFGKNGGAPLASGSTPQRLVVLNNTYYYSVMDLMINVGPTNANWVIQSQGYGTPTYLPRTVLIGAPAAAWAAGTIRPCIMLKQSTTLYAPWEWLSFRVFAQ